MHPSTMSPPTCHDVVAKRKPPALAGKRTPVISLYSLSYFLEIYNHIKFPGKVKISLDSPKTTTWKRMGG